jgi:hypothetical protein
VVELTDVGIKKLVKAEFALAAVEDEVLGTLDHHQRGALYTLLQLATATSDPAACAAADDPAACEDVPPVC